MANAYMLSLLAGQLGVLGDGFVRKHPHCWLVWEPGHWNAPSPSGWTLMPSAHGLSRPGAGDALCFALSDVHGKGLWVGRADSNDIVINDATVSREHVRLVPANGGWKVELAITAKPAQLGGEPLVQGRARPLRPNDLLVLGEVVLTFHDPRSLVTRLETDAVLKTRPPVPPG